MVAKILKLNANQITQATELGAIIDVHCRLTAQGIFQYDLAQELTQELQNNKFALNGSVSKLIDKYKSVLREIGIVLAGETIEESFVIQ